MTGSATRASLVTPAPAADDLLVEREGELAAIADALASSRESAGVLTAIDGSSGLGKTRLLDEACRLGGQMGIEVLAAAGRRFERRLAFGVVRELFEGRVASSQHAQRDRLFAGQAALSAGLLLGGRRADQGPSGRTGTAELAHGLYWLSKNLAAESPTLLVVDDLEWVDEESLRFLLYLAGRLQSAPVSVIVAAGTGAPARSLVRELVAHPAARALRLQPLSLSATDSYLRATGFGDVDAEFVGAVHHATGGNPFLLRHVAAELARKGVEPTAQSAAVVRRLAPAPVVEDTSLRLQREGRDAVALAKAVAILGNSEVRHAAELAGLEPVCAVEICQRLVAAGIFGRAHTLGFIQLTVRNAVEATMPESEAAEQHLRAARLLDRDGAPPEQVAMQLLAARPAGQSRAVEVLCVASDLALARGAPRLAIRLLRRALREPPASEARPKVLLRLGEAEAVAGYPTAVAHLNEAARSIADRDAGASAGLRAAGVLYSRGHWDGAAAALEELVGVSEADTPTARRVAAARAVIAGTVLSSADRSMPAAENPLNDDANALVQRIPLTHRAYKCALGGHDAAEVRALVRPVLRGDELFRDPSVHLLDYYRAIAALVVVEDLETAERALGAAVASARERGSLLDVANARYLRAWVLLRRGRLEAAAADATAALIARRHGWRMSIGGARAILAETALERGEVARARTHIEAGRDVRFPADESLALYLAAKGRLELEQGRAGDALCAYLECGRSLLERGAAGPGIVGWRQGAAAAHRQLGNHEQAQRLLREELARARAFGAPGARGRALHAHGAARTDAARIDDLSEAAQTLGQSEAVLDYARALVDLGAALRRAGRRSDARGPLRLGLEQADRCGAVVLRERARTEIAAAGGRPRRTALHGRDALTPRERQVAELAASGMSNREIARTLFVTVKTVEWHLRHSYEKLEVRSRGELRGIVTGADAEA